MNNKEIALGIVAVLMIIICGAYAYSIFKTPSAPAQNMDATPVVEEVVEEEQVEQKPIETIIPSDTTGTNTTGVGLFSGEEFSFEYPLEYGSLSLKKTVQPGKTNDPEFAISAFISSENRTVPVSIQGNNYDSGTDTPKKPLCPIFKEEYGCAELRNPNGSLYYKLEHESMAGVQVRYEFPLAASKTSLVFSYYENDGVDVAALEKMVASVKVNN
jgi:hypothetical protein